MGREMPANSMMHDNLRTSWPEVVGMACLLAANRILDDRPDVRIEAYYVGEVLPPGYNDKRVRLFVNRDAALSVAQTPVVG